MLSLQHSYCLVLLYAAVANKTESPPSADAPPAVAGLPGAPGPGPVLPGLGVLLPARPAPGHPSRDPAQPPGVPAALPR